MDVGFAITTWLIGLNVYRCRSKPGIKHRLGTFYRIKQFHGIEITFNLISLNTHKSLLYNILFYKPFLSQGALRIPLKLSVALFAFFWNLYLKSISHTTFFYDKSFTDNAMECSLYAHQTCKFTCHHQKSASSSALYILQGCITSL